MLDDMGLFCGLIFLLVGAVLLYKGSSNADASQTAPIIGGAVFLSVGSVLMWNAPKNWWVWKREYRKYRNE